MVEQQHASPPLPRDRGAHQPGCAGTQHDGVIIGSGHGRPSAASRSRGRRPWRARSEEHTSELQSLMRISYAVFCLKKKTHTAKHTHSIHTPQPTLNTTDTGMYTTIVQ